MKNKKEMQNLFSWKPLDDVEKIIVRNHVLSKVMLSPAAVELRNVRS